MGDIHPIMDLKKEPFIKTEFRVEDMKYNWIKQEIKGEEEDVVMDNKTDMIKNETCTCNPEGIKQDPEHYFGLPDVKPVLFKEEEAGSGNWDCNDELILSSWSSQPADAASSTQHNSKDRHTLTSTDLLAMEMKSLGL